MPPNLVYDDVEGKPIETRSISWPPAPEGRNLMYPHMPGTKAWTERFPKSVEEMFPNPLWTPVAKNPTLQGFMMLPIAYHGSPYKFDRFTTKKIGTGEGAQAYGHGLYFSESEKVAQDYADALGNPLVKYIGNQETTNIKLKELGVSDANLLSTLAYEGGVYGHEPTTKDGLKKLFKSMSDSDAEYRAFLKDLEKPGVSETLLSYIQPPSKNVYKVDITPPAEKFLDWDKPLSQQADSVKSALSKVSIDDIGLSYEPISNQGKYLYGSDRGYWVLNKGGRIGRVKNEPKTLADLEEISIGNLMDAVNSVKASEALAKAGIPGIRYLDQGSRQAGKGTYNYVVFNDKDVKILERK